MSKTLLKNLSNIKPAPIKSDGSLCPDEWERSTWFRVDNGGCHGCISNGKDVYFDSIEAAVEACEYLHENSRRQFPYIIMETDKTKDLSVARIVTFFRGYDGKAKNFRDPFEGNGALQDSINLRALDHYLWRESEARGICLPEVSEKTKSLLDNHGMAIGFLIDIIDRYFDFVKNDAATSQTKLPETVR